MKEDEEKKIPAIVEMFTFWFGRETTNWKGIQEAYDLSDGQVNRLRLENKAYRGARNSRTGG